ncbi:hypothetical protein J3F81_004023 [Coemansia sp. RSA 371]|nr:hypothetical protein J3F81_004023 [Coemansia sp. RSA 371]
MAPNRLPVALMIIKSAYPDLNEDEDEIELDIDSLDRFTLRKMYEYVVLDRDEAANEAIQRNLSQDAATPHSAHAAPPQPSVYSKPTVVDHQRMSQLDEKLKRLDSSKAHRKASRKTGIDSSSSGESGSSDSEDSGDNSA